MQVSVLSLLLLATLSSAHKNGKHKKFEVFVDPNKLLKKLSDDAELFSSYSDPAAFVDSHTRWVRDLDYPFAQPTASVVLRPATNEDVVEAVKFATKTGLDLAVRSGGHGASGKFLTEGGLLIDMRSMNDVAYDPDTHYVTVGGGAILNEITDHLAEFGRSPPLGICRGVGAGILHGGWGSSARKYGLTIDFVVAATIVTPDGRLRHVDASAHPDLFWAIRGDVSNFGVLTSVTYDTFDSTGPFSFAQQVLPLESFPTAARYMNSQLDNREFGGLIVVAGGQLVQFLWVWDDNIQGYLDAQAIEPLFKTVGEDYFVWQDFYYQFSDNFPTFSFGSSSAGSFTFSGDEVTDDAFLDAFTSVWSPTSTGIGLFEMWGGAIQDVAPDATAFFARSQQFAWYVSDFWTDPVLIGEKVSAILTIGSDLNGQEGASPELYINHVDGSDENLENGFGTNQERLGMIKAKYDPSNVMSHSYNVRSN